MRDSVAVHNLLQVLPLALLTLRWLAALSVIYFYFIFLKRGNVKELLLHCIRRAI